MMQHRPLPFLPFVFGLVLAGGVLLTSCEKVISVNLNQASPHIVIEAIVTNGPGPYAVVINKTGDYFTPSLSFPPVTTAFVRLSDDAGMTDTLKEDSSGTYLTSKLAGIPGRTYALRVFAEGTEYDATSTMPQEVPIDTLLAIPFRESDGDRGYQLHVLFKDPPAPGNYYCVRFHTSRLPSDSISGQRYLLYEDKLTNGNEADYHVRAGRNNLFPGDTLVVDLLSIDEATYEYYRTTNDILATDRSPTALSPANPNTNLSNGSLGYFSAYAIDTKAMILP